MNEDGSVIYIPWRENSYASIPRHEFFAPIIASSQEDENHIKEESDSIGEWRLFKIEHVSTPPHLGLWVRYLNGAHSKSGSGAGIVIISPYEEYLLFSLRLQFTCTNNIAEHEALLLGLEAVKSRGIQKIIVIGDSDLVVSQLREPLTKKMGN